jgi:hypothetical protein
MLSWALLYQIKWTIELKIKIIQRKMTQNNSRWSRTNWNVMKNKFKYVAEQIHDDVEPNRILIYSNFRNNSCLLIHCYMFCACTLPSQKSVVDPVSNSHRHIGFTNDKNLENIWHKYRRWSIAVLSMSSLLYDPILSILFLYDILSKLVPIVGLG